MDRISAISEINSLVTDLNIEKITHNNSIQGLIKQCKKAAEEITSLQKKSEEYAINDDKMKEYEEALEQFANQKSELLKDKDALQVAGLVLKDTGIKARIIKQYIPIINKLINKYLAALDISVNNELD